MRQVDGDAGGRSGDHNNADLLETIMDPSSSRAIPPADLARSMGIGALPTREEAIATLEKEVLAPVRDLSGVDLWRWQTWVRAATAAGTPTGSNNCG